MPDPSHPGFVLSPTELIMSVVTALVAWPAAKWFGKRLWEQKESDAAATRKAVAELAREVKEGFQHLQALVSATNTRVAELTVWKDIADREIDKLRAEVHSARNDAAKLQGRLDLLLQKEE